MSVKTSDPAKAFGALADNYFVEYTTADLGGGSIEDVRAAIGAAYISSRDEDEAVIDLPRRVGRAHQLTSLLVSDRAITATDEDKRALARVTMSPHPLAEREAIETCRTSGSGDVQRAFALWAARNATELVLRRVQQNTTPLERLGIGITPAYMLGLVPAGQRNLPEVLAARILMRSFTD
jgi:hypothetical protein